MCVCVCPTLSWLTITVVVFFFSHEVSLCYIMLHRLCKIKTKQNKRQCSAAAPCSGFSTVTVLFYRDSGL